MRFRGGKQATTTTTTSNKDIDIQKLCPPSQTEGEIKNPTRFHPSSDAALLPREMHFASRRNLDKPREFLQGH